MCINATTDQPIKANGEPLDLVEDFTYLGNLVIKEVIAAQKEGIGKLTVLLQDSSLYGSQSNTALEQKFEYITAVSNQSC